MAMHLFPRTVASYTGHLSRDIAPIIEIESGDTVEYNIPDAGWGIEGFSPGCEDRKTLVPNVEEQQLGHCLAGPVSIKGAEPGMALEIKIEELVPSNWGWTVIGWPGILNERLGIASESPRTIIWDIDWAKRIATSDFGQKIPVDPFLGFMGVAPPMNGKFSTIEPFPGGGNLDLRELVAGSSLILPIQVEGGLFFCGDCHAAQGDSELTGTALECAAERVILRFILHDRMPYPIHSMQVPVARPVAKTAVGWITTGLHSHLEEALVQAADAMISLIMAQKQLDRQEAATLVTTEVSFRITQAVNRVNGVHAIWPVLSEA